MRLDLKKVRIDINKNYGVLRGFWQFYRELNSKKIYFFDTIKAFYISFNYFFILNMYNYWDAKDRKYLFKKRSSIS